MKVVFSKDKFYSELKTLLPASTTAQRKLWVETIVRENIPIKDLSGLLDCGKKTATRFMWLLAETGIYYPDRLFADLPFLFELSEGLDRDLRTSFASFWLLTNVPPENEGKAIDLLFQWLWSSNTNVSIKSRAMKVLFRLMKKYPELKNELRLCLTDQLDKNTNEFRKRASRILLEIEG